MNQYLVAPEPRRKHWPLVVTVVTLLMLVGGGALVLVTRSRPAAQETTARVVDATSPTPAQLSDLDQDGLSDEDEARYRTNPEVADTDADGFNDGTEVSN